MGMKLVLLVEDDPERAREIQSCVPSSVRCVWAKSAGAACGILKRDIFAGILLDFDLYRSTLGDPHFTGETVATAICETQPRDCQVFVHSQNPSGGRQIAQMLAQAGFSVEQRPWAPEAKAQIQAWLTDVLEWE
jgi:CheY-like chemotaxis protein